MAVSTLKRKIAVVSVLNELNDDSDDEAVVRRPRGPDRTWIRERKNKGAYCNIFKELELTDSEGFRRFMRMDVGTFNDLVNIIGQDITKKDTTMRTAIPPQERLALTLRFLATGETFRSLEFFFRISRKAISYIVVEVVTAIYDNLAKEFLALPSTAAEWEKIESRFRDRWNFPHCVGAVDGKHVRIQGCGVGAMYHNYKGSHSIIMMIAAGGDYEVVWADVGTNGKVSDGSVLNNSEFGHKVKNHDLNLPAAKPLPNRTQKTPYVFIGDDAFALLTNFMKPYSKNALDIFSRVCNYRFSRARRISENVFGILACRWRVLLTTIVMHPGKVRQVCKGLLTLHNWLLRVRETSYFNWKSVDHVDPETHELIPGQWREELQGSQGLLPLQPIQHGANPKLSAKQVREEFKEYFNLEGAVPWQWDNCILSEK